MEYYDQSLENFEKQYLLNRQTINSLKQEIYTYFEGNLNLAHNFEDTGYGDYLEFYVMSLNQDKIQIKLNLISPFIEKQEIETNQNQDQQDDQQVDESENQNSNESENEIQIEDDDEDQNQVEEEEEENENESQIINESEVEEQEESEDQNQVEDENEVEEEENENENESQTENESEIEEQEQQESEIQIEIKEDDEDQNQVEDESEVEEQEKNEIQTEIKEENKLEIDGDNDIEDEDKNENNYCKSNLSLNQQFNNEELQIKKEKNMQPGNQKQVKKNTSFEKIIDHLPLESQSNEFARKQQKYLDQIQDIINLVKMKIPKKDLSNVIQNTFSNILNFHPLEIFEIIQKHPNYKSFEVVESNESIFILKVNKGKQTILLEGYKACSVEQAHSLANQYESIVKNQISSTFLNIEQIQINPQQIYILVEKTFIEQLKKQDIIFFYRNLSLNDLKNFINYSYQLLIKNSIQITKINPENILIGNQYGSDSYEDNEISLNQDLQNAFIIDELSIQQFTTQYTEIYEFELHKHVVQNNNNERVQNFKNSIQNLIEIFFQQISELKLENILDVFNRLQLIINNLIIMKQYQNYAQIKISEKNINKIQIALCKHMSCFPKPFNKILELSKINPSLQINSLVINSYTFPECLKQLFQQLMLEYENKGVEEDKLQDLFLKYQSLFIQQFLQDLKVSSLNQEFGQITVNVFYEQNENDQLSKIINLNEFNENEIDLLKNQNCTVLEYNFELEDYLAFQKLNILIFDENIYYLIGDQQYLLLRYKNYKEIQQLFEFSITLAYFKEIFGQNYLQKYLAYQTTNFQVWFCQEFVNLQQLTYIYEDTNKLLDLQGLKSLIQLNLVIQFWSYSDKLDFSKVIKNFSQSNINTVNLIFDKDNKEKIPKLTYFYKQKQIVNVQIKRIKFIYDKYEDNSTYIKSKYFLKAF